MLFLLGSLMAAQNLKISSFQPQPPLTPIGSGRNLHIYIYIYTCAQTPSHPKSRKSPSSWNALERGGAAPLCGDGALRAPKPPRHGPFSGHVGVCVCVCVLPLALRVLPSWLVALFAEGTASTHLATLPLASCSQGNVWSMGSSCCEQEQVQPSQPSQASQDLLQRAHSLL